jgi:hypothetical protein
MKRYSIVDSNGKKLPMKSFLLDAGLTVLAACALRVWAYALVNALVEIPYIRIRYIMYLYPIHLTSIAEVVWLLSAFIVGGVILLWEFSRKTRGEDDILDDLNQ